MKKIILLFNTVKYLKFKQIKYQIYYRLFKPGSFHSYKGSFTHINFLNFTFTPPVYKTYLGSNTFSFLNQERHFSGEIDWNYQGNGKLWNYNLQYANYLLQEDIKLETKLHLLQNLNSALESGLLALEPYPVSLRAINIIRLLSQEKYKDYLILNHLYAELNFLFSRLEYHLLGNHLLENGFALIMGGAFFNNLKWIKSGHRIIKSELGEQILEDGGHFELSPMYHQIILFRVLELLDWYSNWGEKDSDFEQTLQQTAAKMRAWLQNISFTNGDLPHFNDSTTGIAYSTSWILNYAKLLNIKVIDLPLGDSGYRSIKMGQYECKIDFAQAGASYQPGHAHADALSFILYYKDMPIFVEQGTSTYNIGDKRSHERSTQSHNTVVFDNRNQSEVWGGFRLGNRAKTTILKDEDDLKIANHNGFSKYGVIHTREFIFEDNKIIIKDLFSNQAGLFFIHLYDNVEMIKQTSSTFLINKDILLKFENFTDIVIENYDLAKGYNSYTQSIRFVVKFNKVLITKILINN